MRLAFVVLILLDGVGILLYIILAIIMPDAEQVKGVIERMENEAPAQKKSENSTWLGVILILLGAYFLLNSFNLLSWVRSDQFRALLLILIGIALLVKRAVR